MAHAFLFQASQPPPTPFACSLSCDETSSSVISEMRMVVAGGVKGIDHAAHFGGVFAGEQYATLYHGKCCSVAFDGCVGPNLIFYV